MYYYVKIDINKHSNWEQATKREVLLIAFLIVINNSSKSLKIVYLHLILSLKFMLYDSLLLLLVQKAKMVL